MISYKVVERENPSTRQKVFYAQVSPVTPMTLDQVAELIERRSALSSADVKGVLDALQFEVLHALLDGKSAPLAAPGSSRPTLASRAAATAEEFQPGNIKNVRVRFTPSASLMERLRANRVSLRNVTAPATGSEEEGQL